MIAAKIAITAFLIFFISGILIPSRSSMHRHDRWALVLSMVVLACIPIGFVAAFVAVWTW